MEHTGIFATEEERLKVKKAAENAEGGISGQAWKSAKELCHKFALDHGLPDIEGYYGMTKEGEFVKPECELKNLHHT